MRKRKKALKNRHKSRKTADEGKIDGGLFKSIIDSISDILIVIGPKNYSILAANKNYLDKEGLTLQAIRGKNVMRSSIGEMLPAFRRVKNALCMKR